MTLGLVAATSSGIAWIGIAGWIVTFAAGAAFVSTSQEHLTAAMGDRRAPAVSWNNSALYAGTAAGTFLLGMTELGSASFTVLAASFSALAVLFSALVLLRRHPIAAEFESHPKSAT
ncbi:hypothetical protein [Nocardia sp. NPDC051750]|uniref:hypothetical protein n=1 Tax=Nocardia sp. NPDC051750 TaxID=3364325 RepID=UPI0037A02141